jgi:hypothetical protein
MFYCVVDLEESLVNPDKSADDSTRRGLLNRRTGLRLYREFNLRRSAIFCQGHHFVIGGLPLRSMARQRAIFLFTVSGLIPTSAQEMADRKSGLLNRRTG